MRSQDLKVLSLECSIYSSWAPCLCLGSILLASLLEYHKFETKTLVVINSAVISTQYQLETQFRCWSSWKCLLTQIIFLHSLYSTMTAVGQWLFLPHALQNPDNTSFVTVPSRKPPTYWNLWAVSWQWYQTNELKKSVQETSMIFKSSPSMTLSPKQAKGQSCPHAFWLGLSHLSTAVGLPAALSGQELTEILGKKPDNHPES